MDLENSSRPKPTQITDALLVNMGMPPKGLLRGGHWGVGDRTFLILPDHSQGFS
jgi:hypothetical protein